MAEILLHAEILLIQICLLSIVIKGQTDFEKQCQALTPAAIYYRGSCIVRKTERLSFSQATASCNDFSEKFQGHLIHMLDKEIGYAIIDELVEDHEKFWVGLTQKNKRWFWIDSDGNLAWEIGDKVDNVEKLDYNDAKKCGRMKVDDEQDFKLEDWKCEEEYQYLCQYHDRNVCYDKVYDNKRGKDELIGEFKEVDAKQCAIECFKVPVCQSFSYSNVERRCLLHMYLHGVLNKEDEEGYKIYEKHN